MYDIHSQTKFWELIVSLCIKEMPESFFVFIHVNLLLLFANNLMNILFYFIKNNLLHYTIYRKFIKMFINHIYRV